MNNLQSLYRKLFCVLSVLAVCTASADNDRLPLRHCCEDAELTKAAVRTRASVSTPLQGDVCIPIILAAYQDVPFSIENVREVWDEMANKHGYSEHGANGCMADYFKKYPVLYAGPAKTPEGYPCGSMGPTTANRMDPYVDEFQANGASLVMIAKGNRSDVVTEACKKHGGFYLGTIGGVAAVLSQSSIKSIECVEYPELGMEAVWKIEVEDFPAFILVDDKGNDFFKTLKPWTPCAK